MGICPPLPLLKVKNVNVGLEISCRMCPFLRRMDCGMPAGLFVSVGWTEMNSVAQV